MSNGNAISKEPQSVQKQVAEAVKAERRRQFDWDVRGLLAIMALVGAFSLAFTQVLLIFLSLRASTDVDAVSAAVKAAAEIPAWAAAIVAGVSGFYFGSRGGVSGVDTNGNGVR